MTKPKFYEEEENFAYNPHKGVMIPMKPFELHSGHLKPTRCVKIESGPRIGGSSDGLVLRCFQIIDDESGTASPEWAYTKSDLYERRGAAFVFDSVGDLRRLNNDGQLSAETYNFVEVKE